MKIVIDGRLWVESGLGRYIRNLVSELQEIDKSSSRDSNEYYVLLLEKDFKIVTFTGKNFHKVLADFKWYSFSEQIKLLKLLRELKPDLVHFPHFNVPVFYQGKFVVTIHDLIHQHFQTREMTTHNFITHGVKKFGYKVAFSRAIKGAVKIITPSEFIKKQLEKEWGVEKKKIMVTYEGVDEGVIREIGGIKEEDFVRISEKFGIKKPYLFYVGNAQPHKNILGLVRVFREIKEKNSELSLVLAGPESFFWEKIKEGLVGEEGLGGLEKEGIILTGFLEEREMVVLYKNAEAFVMPSLEEGFGIPLLEAMAAGVPVISSNAGSLPEVGGDAALYFDPLDEEGMERVIREILGDKGKREEMIKKGLKQVEKFSWKKMAEETLKVYREGLEGEEGLEGLDLFCDSKLT